MREGIRVEVKAADRACLEAIVADRNSPQKHVWRARIVLLTAGGAGTSEIMRQAGYEQSDRLALAGAVHARRGSRACCATRRGPRASRRWVPRSTAKVVALTQRRSAGRNHPLDGRDDGESSRHQPQFGTAHLAGARAAAAPGAPVQAVAVTRNSCPKLQGYRRPLYRSAGACDCAQRR